MRAFTLAAALLLSACSPGQHAGPALTVEQEAHRQMLEDIEATKRYMARTSYARSPDGQAREQCQYRTSVAFAGQRSRRLVDLEGMALANDLTEACLTIFRRTGVLPNS